MVNSFTILSTHLTELFDYASSGLPNEVCGLIAGNKNSSLNVIPIKNILNSPVRFKMDPQEQVDAMIQIHDQGLDLLAIYHSHPTGPAALSSTDLAEATFPQTVQLILSQTHNNWSVKGFIIHPDQVQEVPIIIRNA